MNTWLVKCGVSYCTKIPMDDTLKMEVFQSSNDIGEDAETVNNLFR